MSTRIVCDRLVIPTFPFELDPRRIANELTNQGWIGQAKFATSVTIRYSPNVPTSTSGETIIAATQVGTTDFVALSAATCKAVTPVWKGTTLVVPKDYLNFERWSRTGSPHLWLGASGVRGTVVISCTIKATTAGMLTPTPSRDAQLAHLNTYCFVGPVLAGFSLVSCMPYRPQPVWQGTGQVININLRDGKGTTTSSRYIRTPDNKSYVAVRYGFGNSFNYVYTTGNKPYAWKSNTHVIWAYKEQSADWYNVPVNYYASWRPIKGSTSWWAEINPTSDNYLLGGVTTTWYHPTTQLILYYEYPDVDIFSSDFAPSIQVEPRSVLPCPPGDAQPSKVQLLPMNNSRLQSMWSAFWNPDLSLESAGRDLRYRFEKAKYALTKWPVNCSNNKLAISSDTVGEEESLSESKDTVGAQGEPAWLCQDSSA